MMNKNEGLARVHEEAKRLKTEDEMEAFTPKLRKKPLVLPKPKNGVDNAAEMAKPKNNLPSERMESSNIKIAEIMNVSPIRYIIMMSLGLVVAIIGGVMLYYIKDLICGLLIISGVGIFLIELVDFGEAKHIEKKIGLENENRKMEGCYTLCSTKNRGV